MKPPLCWCRNTSCPYPDLCEEVDGALAFRILPNQRCEPLTRLWAYRLECARVIRRIEHWIEQHPIPCPHPQRCLAYFRGLPDAAVYTIEQCEAALRAILAALYLLWLPLHAEILTAQASRPRPMPAPALAAPRQISLFGDLA